MPNVFTNDKQLEDGGASHISDSIAGSAWDVRVFGIGLLGRLAWSIEVFEAAFRNAQLLEDLGGRLIGFHAIAAEFSNESLSDDGGEVLCEFGGLEAHGEDSPDCFNAILGSHRADHKAILGGAAHDSQGFRVDEVPDDDHLGLGAKKSGQNGCGRLFLGGTVGGDGDILDFAVERGFVFDGGEFTDEAVAHAEGDIDGASESFARSCGEEYESVGGIEDLFELALHFDPHADVIEGFEASGPVFELDEDAFAGGHALGGECGEVAAGLIFGGELARLERLAFLGIEAAKGFECFDGGIGHFAALSLACEPDAIDQDIDSGSLLGAVEHDCQTASSDGIGDDFLRDEETGRLSGEDQASVIGSFIGTAKWDEFGASIADARVIFFRLHLHADLADAGCEPEPKMFSREYLLVIADERIAIDDVGGQWGDVCDQEQGEADGEDGEQPDQDECEHESPEDDGIPKLVVQLGELQVLDIDTEPIGGSNPREEQEPSGEDFEPIERIALSAESSIGRPGIGFESGEGLCPSGGDVAEDCYGGDRDDDAEPHTHE